MFQSFDLGLSCSIPQVEAAPEEAKEEAKSE